MRAAQYKGIKRVLQMEEQAKQIAAGLDDYEREYLLACCGIKRFVLPAPAREAANAALARFRRLGLMERDPRAEAVEVMQPSALGLAVSHVLQKAQSNG